MFQPPNSPPPWQNPQQPTQTPADLQNLALHGLGTVNPQPQVQQAGGTPDLATAMRAQPSPGMMQYFNRGVGVPQAGPQLRGMPTTVKPPPLMGPNPAGAASAGYNGLSTRPLVR